VREWPRCVHPEKGISAVTERAAERVRRPRRRLLAAVAVGAIAVSALAGCQADAGTAAYVGKMRITDAKVNQTAGSVTSAPGLTTAELRRSTLVNLAFIEIAKRYATEKGYAAPDISADRLDALATRLNVDPKDAATNAFVVAAVTARAWADLLRSKTPAVTPTDAELMDIYQRAVAVGLAPPGTFNTIKPQIAAVPELGAAIAVQRDLEARMRTYGVSTSPRYQGACPKAPCAPVAFPLLLLQTQAGSFDAVVLPLGKTVASPAVVDAPATTAPQITTGQG
jgi:hypothetical protein